MRRTTQRLHLFAQSLLSRKEFTWKFFALCLPGEETGGGKKMNTAWREKRYTAGGCKGRKLQRNKWEWKKTKEDIEKGGWVNSGRENGNFLG